MNNKKNVKIIEKSSREVSIPMSLACFPAALHELLLRDCPIALQTV